MLHPGARHAGAANPMRTAQPLHPTRAGPPTKRRVVAAAAEAAAAGSGSGGEAAVVGIDLGTTNSAVARIKNGAPVCIPNSDGDALTPSIVAFGEGGATLVGRAARGQPAATTYYSVKRVIGRGADDPIAKEEAGRLAYELTPDDDGAVMVACPHVEPGALYPEEVSAVLLTQLLADAARDTGRAVTKAVISVPAYFDEAQREATIAAGQLAGLEVVRLIKEPVAAALAYGLDLREEQVVLVFDLGGGTYDISLLEVGNGTIEVLSTGGDPHLGGDDWDAAIVGWLEREHLHPAGINTREPEIAANLKALAEYAKIQLSDHDSVVLRMPIGGPNGGPLRVTLTRQQLDGLGEDLFRRARLPLDAACWQAGVDLNEAMMGLQEKREDMARRGVPEWKREMLKLEIRPRGRSAISRVLLVGGATRMPSVRRFISHMTGLAPDEADVDPDEAVALGAAVQAGILQGEVSELMVLDQWQASLMRSLAQLQLRQSKQAREAVEGAFDMEGLGEGEAADGGESGGSGFEDEGEGEEDTAGAPLVQQQTQPKPRKQQPGSGGNARRGGKRRAK
ncbi:molecular chaperone [Raphidocelis subcapitata]|uniref:Molecular chaperone n=1 Tax=Raphidocelis subcapitata TaxID=307507 RepID=A0A2V0NTH3_9CHLO|nr:molecular chaperone [Raphidocelis subcapitata]|eukprot:GBF90941.1 molecular chaperone [Raphidocelis subcapitata]